MTTTKTTSRGRIALAVSGIVALAATAVGHSVDTAAQATDTAKANSSFAAKSSFWPTPVVSSIKCEQKFNDSEEKPYLSWTAPSGVAPAGGWKYRIVMHRISGSTFTGETYLYANDYSGTNIYLTENTTLRGKDWYARVHTINGPKTSTGYRGAGMWYNGAAWNYADCTGNYEFVDNQNGLNRIGTFVRQPMALGGMLNEVPLDESAETLPPEGTLTALEEELATARETSAPSSTATSQSTEPSSSTPSASTPATTAADDEPTTSTTVPTELPAGTTESSTAGSSTTAPSTVLSTRTTTSTTPRSTTTVTANAAASTATTSQAAPTTSSTVPVAAGPVALPGGGEAEIVGGTRLVVSEGGAPVCTATVREGSTLKLRAGVLELTDAAGTHTVDQESCELS